VVEERYRTIVAAVDAEFARNRELHGNRIRCGPGCTECCHHVFSITTLEAAEVARGVASLPEQLRREIQTRAVEYMERRLIRGERLPCPALHLGKCSIYEHRPLMCHKFGMPLFNPDKPDRIFACELNFANGEEIHDPDLIQIQTGIHEAWTELKNDSAAMHPPGDERVTVTHAILRAAHETGVAPAESAGHGVAWPNKSE
jgi:Fe-S-cluster containining protein